MTQFLTLGGLLRLARDTVTNPQEGATTVLSVAPPPRALWLMFAIVVVLSLFLGEVVTLLTGVPEDGPITGAYSSPLTLGLIQAAFLVIMVHAIHRIGGWFGGRGRFEEAFILIIWLHFIFLLVQVVQIGLMVILPPIAPFFTVLAVGLFLWLLVNFISVLHGFTSLGMVLVMTIVSAFGIIFVLSLVLSLLGLVPDPGGL
jgi:hypothetical protein